MLDDHEHLPDAVVHVADQGADRGTGLAEGQLAGGRRLQAHLVLDPGDIDAVALAELAVLADQVLGYQEHRQALGARAVPLGAGEDQVEDVLGHVMLGTGDEPLDPLDVPAAVRLPDGAGPPGADVGACVRLGQRHRGRPLALDGQLGEALLVGGAHGEESLGERGTAGVHPDGRVGAEDQLRDGPAQRARRIGAAELGRELQAEPLGVHEGREGLPESGRHPDRASGRIEDRRVPVGLGERLGEGTGSEPVHLVQDPAGSLLIQVRIRLRAQQVLPPQHLEQVELDVTEVALVVAHLRLRYPRGHSYQSVTYCILPASNRHGEPSTCSGGPVMTVKPNLVLESSAPAF